MRELIVKIKMSDTTYESFRKDSQREARKVGAPLREKGVIEIDEDLMMIERTHATIYCEMLGGIAACDLVTQVDEFFKA